MANGFESPESVNNVGSSEESFGTGRIERGNEKERHWPLINAEENGFIENTGGEFAGFVETEHGRQKFEDLRVDRRAYYDKRERAVIEMFVATEGVNEEGGNELQGPGEVTGFTIMMVRRSRSGHELGRPEIISLQPKDFPARIMDIKELRLVAGEVRDLLVAHAPEATPSELPQQVEEHLQSKGWQHNKR